VDAAAEIRGAASRQRSLAHVAHDVSLQRVGSKTRDVHQCCCIAFDSGAFGIGGASDPE
jgi:hypothetical protein